MFKRLFLSLLLLSALASEGIINFPVNLYSMYLADIDKLGFYEDQVQSFYEKLNNEVATRTSGTSYSLIPASKVSDEGLFVLSSDTSAYFAGLKPLEIPGDCINCEKPDFFSFYTQEVSLFDETVFAFYDSRDVIIKSSDNSPPLYC